jgi:hypothetical protein
MTTAQRDVLATAITGTFMWSFKKGDNIIYNLEVIWELYGARNSAGATNKAMYNKPIIVGLMSIIECILDDFANRIVGHVHDPIPNMPQADIAAFRTRKYDKLEHYIAASRRFHLFGTDNSFYDSLNELRKARNRVHIQNSSNQLASDEFNVFTNELLLKAQQAFRVVLSNMIVKFTRNGRTVPAGSVPLPWRV